MTTTAIKKRLGVNLEGWRSNAAARMFSDPRVIALLPQLHLGFGRWFGGTTANYANWRLGKFSASGNPAEGIVKGQPALSPMPASSWQRVIAELGGVSLVQLNLCTEPDGKFVVDAAGVERQVLDQLAMIEELVLTLPAGTELLVECGNEVYRHGDPATAAYAANPAFYCEAVKQAVAAIKGVPVAARFGACSLLDIYAGINPTWRATIEGELAGVVDAFTYHHYLPIPEAPSATNADALVADALADFEHAYLPTFATMPAGHTAWTTEWNYAEQSSFAAAMAASPTHGLVIAALALRHLSEPVIELTSPHAALGSGGIYPAIAPNSSGAPALTTYGQALAGVGWLLNPSGPAPVTFGYPAA